MTEQTPDKSKPGDHGEGIHEACLGETIDGFYLEECIHESAVSHLYRVTHPEHDLPMVMKVPKLSAKLPPSCFAAFETELRILSRLHGVYTPKIIAKGDLASCPYLVMEMIEGNVLQQALVRAPLSVDELIEIMVPVCKAVHELHRHNIIHLDLKPDNIHNRDDGQTVILDFGTAHHTHLPDMYEDAHEGGIITLDYVAPEQLLDIRHDSRSDLYALGVIMYQLATAQLPFGKVNPITVKKRLFMPVIPPRVHNENVPPWLQEIILKCLERHPDDRFSTAKQIAYALSHPNMVTLTKRSELVHKPGIIQIAYAWLNARRNKIQAESQLHPHEQITQAPHVLVALDLEHASEELQQALRNTLRRLVHIDKHSFFTVITVVEKDEMSSSEDYSELVETEHPTHIHRQMELRHWMKALKLPNSRVNYQVVKGHVADEIISYAKHHVVDQIVIGARGSSTLRRFMGSVSTKVVAEAPCTVTVVRTRRDLHSKGEEGSGQ